MENFDVVVVGGGMIGAASAQGFAQQGLSVLMLESYQPKAFDTSQAIDLRVSAISQASVNLLKQLDAWSAISAMRLCPYQQLQVWEDPQNKLIFDCAQLDLPELGFMVENRIIQLGLWQANEQAGVTRRIVHNSQLQTNTAEGVSLKIDDTEVFAKLMVVADGANSSMRQQLGLGISAWDYRHDCFAINIKLDAPQQTATWQQFYPSGPRALLPLAEQHAALIWYDSKDTIRGLKQLTSNQLKHRIEAEFPALPGDFDILNSASFPLTRRHVNQYVKHRAVVIGDAAHTINPLAGQGVNLGYRDVKCLLEQVEHCGLEELDKALRRFEVRRKPDNLSMQTSMDVFYLMFSNSLSPLQQLRKLAIKGMQHSGPIKNWTLKYALGDIG
ncbi:2-octaprenyl-3-methyl-6-methoxy-1,4-benzoquinol hydroxylase [Agarivorans sp. Toyoura001]|uniref:FAD-dependent monooxygenase n=1 Tax=Agarivorans sp. Toyoura001 TaxID=2283141 RepID=UPI0010D46B35|nr:FAD-dependent monooxygenase [Agarivorans sp. Toyoura001]GDY24335.1 2-octaprenyl-3-methyl-6-methoxy-1,4-benzoquinol hydroxylase [Agarivorans sp. Toyoura001]